MVKNVTQRCGTPPPPKNTTVGQTIWQRLQGGQRSPGCKVNAAPPPPPPTKPRSHLQPVTTFSFYICEPLNVKSQRSSARAIYAPSTQKTVQVRSRNVDELLQSICFSQSWSRAHSLFKKKKKKSCVTPAVLTVLMRRLIRLRQDKGQPAHVLEIDHNGQVTGGLNTNRAPTGCLLNCSASTNGS